MDCKGGKCAAFSVLYFYAIIWINFIDFFWSPSWNFRFFVLTKSTVPRPQNWHMAPPWCPKSTSFRADWRFYFIFAYSNDDGGGSTTGDIVFLLCLCSIFARLARLRDDFPVLLCNARVQKIFGDSWSICQSRSHWTSFLGASWWFWWKMEDFPVSVRSTSVDGRKIACVREDFWRSLVDVPMKMLQRSRGIWISWKKRGFPGFSSIRSTWVLLWDRLWQIDQYDQESPGISLNLIPYGGLQGREVCGTLSFVFLRCNFDKFDRLFRFREAKFSIFRTH